MHADLYWAGCCRRKSEPPEPWMEYQTFCPTTTPQVTRPPSMWRHKVPEHFGVLS